MGLVVGNVRVRLVPPHSFAGFRPSPEYLCWMSRIFGWLGWGIVPPLYAPAAPHPGGGQAPALHFSPSTWFEIFRVTLPTRSDGAWILACARMTKWGCGNDEAGGSGKVDVGNDRSGGRRLFAASLPRAMHETPLQSRWVDLEAPGGTFGWGQAPALHFFASATCRQLTVRQTWVGKSCP